MRALTKTGNESADMVTIRELAQRCGCSASSVSMVLNNRPLAQYIPARTKASIRRIGEELKYQPNIFAQSLRAKRSYAVGVMIFDITERTARTLCVASKTC
jgi:DNA-binding LacI/PurR family transcriptional regulator